MPSYRIDRISEEVRHALDSLIRQLNDPRIGGTWSVTRVEVTRDLRYEKTYAFTRPWDGSVKTIDSCILTRNAYRENKSSFS